MIPIGISLTFLKERGFERRKCKQCGKYFWSIEEREICEDCEPTYYFLQEKIAKRELNYISSWKEFSKFIEKYGYTPIKRYPVIPRWRDDVFFVQASIYDFQPHVVSGEVPPPANPLVVPQFCLRFNDIENVGITGRHFTGFVMIGRHYFGEKYDPNELFEPIFEWYTKGMKIPEEKLCFIEDEWSGGGNAGPCVETWAGGLELGNTVFMIYKVTSSGLKEMRLKVLDEGDGQERWAWFCSGEPTSYISTFPTVIEYLEKETGIKIDRDLLRKFVLYSKLFDLTERDLDFNWISRMTGIDEETIKREIFLYRDLFVIADHTRSLIFAIKDGAIPSNTGQGYYLRILLRRIFEIMRKRGFHFDLIKIFELHMRFLREEFEDLADFETLEIIKEIVEVEKKKWEEMRKRAERIIKRIKEVTPEKVKELYESHGITPEMLEEHGIFVPKAYYELVKIKEEIKEERKVEEVPEIETEEVFYKDWRIKEIEAKVLKIIGNKVILDKTIFYPEGGGQKCDLGYINDSKVLKVYKIGKTIVHEVDKISFKEGDTVKLKINFERRLRLMRHHTATHIILQACQRVLGKHVWQQGAEKDEDIARLDISHFRDISVDEIQEIERIANKIVFEGRKVKTYWMERNEAEKKFGFRIYQGGVVPGKKIRIVEIEDWDVQACCGLHVENTRDVLLIKIVGVEKIKDGVYRILFKAGDKALEEIQRRDRILLDLSKEWKVNVYNIKERALKFFEDWKESLKKNRELERWILRKIYEALKEIDLVEGPKEIEIGRYVGILKELEKEGFRDKAIKVGEKMVVLGDEKKFNVKKVEKTIGNVKVCAL